jgi:hypothetical protein
MLPFGEAIETGGSEMHRRIKQEVRSRHEACNKKFKEWEILQQFFHHSVDKLLPHSHR